MSVDEEAAVDTRGVAVEVEKNQSRKKWAKRALGTTCAVGVGVAIAYGGSYLYSQCSSCLETCGQCVNELGQCSSQMAGLKEQVSIGLSAALSGVENITEVLKDAQRLGIDVRSLLQRAVDNCDAGVLDIPIQPGSGLPGDTDDDLDPIYIPSPGELQP